MFDKTIHIPAEILSSWTNSLSVLCQVVKVHSAFIAQNRNNTIQILCSNRKDNKNFQPGKKFKMQRPAVEKAMLEQEFIYIRNISDSKSWNSLYPHETNITTYLGNALFLPDNSYFATLTLICHKEKQFSDTERNIILQFNDLFELHLKNLWNEQLIKVSLPETEKTSRTSFKEISNKNYSFTSGIFSFDINHNCKAYIPRQGLSKYNFNHSYIGKMLDDIFKTDDAQQVKQLMDISQQTGEIQSYDFVAEISQVKKLIRLLVFATGSDGYFVVMRDITNREITDNTIKLFNDIIEHSYSSVAVTNFEGEIVFCNTQFEVLTGYSRDELIGKKMSVIKSGKQSKSFYDEMWQTINAGNVWQGEICNKRKNGELYWEHSTVYPSKDTEGNIAHFINIKEETTHIRELHKELFETKAKAADAEAVQNSFISNISHEIRTPMNAIVGFSDLLRLPSITEKQRKEFIELIIKNTNQLQNIIDDVLDLSEIEAGRIKIEKKKVNMNGIMNEMLEFFENQNKTAFRKDIIFRLKCEIKDEKFIIITDEHRLRQILQNLLGNALKFTNKGVIEFGYTIESQHGLFIRFFVKDTGVGIADEKVNLIFSRFGQVESPFKRSIRGMGLGLPITKKLVELLGGEIWVKSEVGKGSMFFFTIPYDFKFLEQTNTDDNDTNLQNDTTFAHINQKYSWANKTILLVEDEESNYKYYKEVLKRTQAELIWKQNGRIATEYCQKNMGDNRIDVILMDIKMPEQDGIETTKKIIALYKDAIKKNIVNTIPPIIAQTAYANHTEKESSMKAGCIDFVTKPLKANELLLIIDKYI